MEFNVKNSESALEFFNQHALQKPNDKSRDHFSGDGPNVYYLMRDEILITKSDKINVGDKVNFELIGREQNTGKRLKNKYSYELKEYDSVCNQLVLQDFKIVVE